MNLKSTNIKLLLGAIYLLLMASALLYLVMNYKISDFFSYEFIKLNRELILGYKEQNFILLNTIFFIFSIVWVLLLGPAMPLLLFAGFVFGKWWGFIIVITSTTIGATVLYILVNIFFRDFIINKLSSKFMKLKIFFKKNELIYFICFRFVGGGGTPHGIQNILPVLFDMSLKNYVIATFIGSVPSMFVSVALGSGIERVIDQNVSINFLTVFLSPEIYIPIIGFSIILIAAFILKKFYFKNNN